MKTLTRCALAAVAAVVILSAVYLLLVSAPVRTTSTEAIVFSARTPEDISSISVENESGTFHFYFDTQEGGFVVDDIPPHLVNLDAFYAILVNSARVGAVQSIQASQANLQDFGLAPPRATAEIVFSDGETLSLRIGASERVSGHYYAAVEGYSEVFVFPAVIAQQFLGPKTGFVSMSLTPPLALSSPLSAVRDISFAGDALDRPIAMQATTGGGEDVALAALSFGAATHIVRSEGAYQLDQASGIELFSALFDIQAAKIVDYNLSEEAFLAFGFDMPYMAVDFDMVSGVGAPVVPVNLRFVQAENGLYYATRLGSGAVFLVERLPFFDIAFERLALRWFITPFLMDLTAITVASPTGAFRFEIDSTDPRNITAFYNGAPLETPLFHAFFRLITSAAHDGVYLGALEPGQEPLLTIRYEYGAEKKEDDLLTLYTGGVRRANVFVNGVGEFAMNDAFVQRVLEGVENLISGNEVTENW